MNKTSRTIEYLPISNSTLDKFKAVLKRFGVEKVYAKKFSNFNNENDWEAQCYYLSSYTALKGLNKESLLDTTRELNLSNDLDQIRIQLDILLSMTLKEVTEMYPKVQYEVLDMLYFSTESFIKTVMYQQADYYCFTAEYQNLILTSIINNLYELTSYSLIIPSDPLVLCNMLIFEVEFPYLWKVAVADRILDLYKMLHDMRGTKFCILNVNLDESHGHISELAYIIVDTQLRVDSVDHMKIIYPGISENGCNDLSDRMPQEVLKDMDNLCSQENVIFIGYDIGKQLQHLLKFESDYGNGILELPPFICLKRGNDKFSGKSLVRGDLGNLLNTYRVTEHNIDYYSNRLFDASDISPNDVRYNTTAIYLLLENMRFSI